MGGDLYVEGSLRDGCHPWDARRRTAGYADDDDNDSICGDEEVVNNLSLGMYV